MPRKKSKVQKVEKLEQTKPRESKLRILVISTTIWPVPLKGYGGLEMICYWLACELAKMGHEVGLVAPVGSVLPDNVKLIPVAKGEPELQAFQRYKGILKDWDVIIDHQWSKPSYLAKVQNPELKIIGVCHAPVPTMYQSPPPVRFPCFVGLSHAHAREGSEHLGIPFRVVYNGIDLDFYTPDPTVKRNDRYLFLNRISRCKGAHVAIDIARRLRINLDVAGDTDFTQDPAYAQRVISLCENNIQWWGSLTRKQTVEFYRTRKALLNTILWRVEPFGLVVPEANACGMPVLAFNRGSMPELIKNGINGFVVDTQEEMEELIKEDAVSEIKPENCRAVAEQFSIRKMAENYLKLCEDVLNGREW